jgi:hypothetical protein
VGKRPKSTSKNLIAVMGVLLMAVGITRPADAAPLTVDTFAFADLCVLFDCGAASTLVGDYEFVSGTPEGEVRSLTLPGLGGFAGFWFYLYQIQSDPAATADIIGLTVVIPGLFPPGTTLYCTDCGGTQAPSSAASASDPIVFSLPGLPPGESSVYFGAVSPNAPGLGGVDVMRNGASAVASALTPSVPEPATLSLLGLGIAALAARRRRNR